MHSFDSSQNLSTNALPDTLQGVNLPAEFKALEQGRFDVIPPLKEVELSGGSKAQVYKIEGVSTYACMADIAARFPEEGNVAVNSACVEKVTCVDGDLRIDLNGREIALAKGSYVVLAPGDSYSISGNGKIVVTTEGTQGCTHVVKQFDEPKESTDRTEALTREFLRYLISADPNTAGTLEFQALKLDPRTCPLEPLSGESTFMCGYGPNLQIEKVVCGPGSYKYDDNTIFELGEGEIAVTYHWSDTAPLAGGGGSAHRRLKVREDGHLESVEREIFGIFMS